MDNFELSAHFANATPELSEVLAERLAVKEQALQEAKEALADALAQERAGAAKTRDARERRAILQHQLVSLESEAMDAAVENSSNFLDLTKRRLVLKEQIILLDRAITNRELRTARDAKRAVLAAQRDVAAADYDAVNADQYAVLNRILLIKRQESAELGTVSLDVKAINTGKLATLGERLRQLARIQLDWDAAISKYDVETAEKVRELELQGDRL